MDQNSIVSIISMTFAVFSPVIIAYAKRESWGSVLKTAIPILVSIIIAVLWIVMSGQWQKGFEGWVYNILYVYGAQQLFYTTVLKGWTSAIEAARNDTPGRHEEGVPPVAADTKE